MYVCTVPNGNACDQWVEYVGLLPALSISDAAAIGGAILLVWAIGYGFGVAARVIFNR